MPRWIVEDPSTVYFILGIAALGLGVALWLRQERKYLYGLGAVLALALLVALLDFLIVTDYERMQLHIKDMAGAVERKDADRIFTHVSDQFRLGGATKSDFRRWVSDRIKNGDITELIVWDFERGDISRDKREAKILFLVKGRGPQLERDKFLLCIATFTLDADGEWRLSTFELRDPIKDPAKADKMPIPYLNQ